jgi:hypothetical protein
LNLRILWKREEAIFLPIHSEGHPLLSFWDQIAGFDKKSTSTVGIDINDQCDVRLNIKLKSIYLMFDWIKQPPKFGVEKSLCLYEFLPR